MIGDARLVEDLTKQFELLLGSLDCVRAISPPSSHVLRQPPMERAWTCESIALARKSISTCQMQVASFSNILNRALSICSNLDRSLHSCINPINSLPTELIQHVVGFAVESPSNCGRILNLACVCKTWNMAIFALSELFVAPDLVKWPVEYVQKWLSRSAFRPLYCNLRRAHDAEPPILISFLQTLPLFNSRIRALHVRVDQDFEQFSALWVGVQMQELEHLTVMRFCSDKDELDLSKAVLPKLRTLYTPSLRVIVPPTTPFLRNFGCRMDCLKDIETCSTAVNNSEALLHVALFASSREVEAMGQPLQEVTFFAPQIESLCLYGYFGGDYINMEPYLLVLSTLPIHTLELVRMDVPTYSLAVQAMSIRKSSDIKTLFLRTHDDANCRLSTKSLDPYLEALYREETLSNDPNLLPKLHTVIIQKAPTARNDHTMNIDQVEQILAPRMGVLKRLILPQDLEPIDDPKGDTQVGFSHDVDRHGLDVDVDELYFDGETLYTNEEQIISNDKILD
ncbi:hypothetical protein DL93DRAFT_2158128 [Clavulina sp. PMI_390]|nr:hypothetical protein DL93DRAFT_2158128 [Clavulina sp. PMI_390]